MQLRIWYEGAWHNVKETSVPKTARQLLSYLSFAGGNDCFSKFSGGVYKITKQLTWVFVCRCYTDLSFGEYLKISKDENYGISKL